MPDVKNFNCIARKTIKDLVLIAPNKLYMHLGLIRWLGGLRPLSRELHASVDSPQHIASAAGT
jgi:hypothetical protein